jgi:hypothetical protein
MRVHGYCDSRYFRYIERYSGVKGRGDRKEKKRGD